MPITAGVIIGVSTHTPHQSFFWWPVHLKMKKSILALFLLTLASHGTWCAAERSTKVDAAHLRPHLQVQESHGQCASISSCFLLLSWCFRFSLATVLIFYGNISEIVGCSETEGKKLLEIQSPRKLGHGHSLTHHEVNTVENHPRRMAIGHKGGSMGGGGSGGGSSAGGGGAASETRPHKTTSAGAVALPVPMTSILTLVFTSAIVLSAFSFWSSNLVASSSNGMCASGVAILEIICVSSVQLFVGSTLKLFDG